MNKQLLIGLLLITTAVFNTHAQHFLGILKPGGEYENVQLTEVQKLTFSDGKLTIDKKTEESSTYLLSGLQRMQFTFETSVPQVEHAASELLSLYPVPAQSVLNVCYNCETQDIMQVCIINMQGKTVLSKTVPTSNGENRIRINVQDLTRGLYLCCIKTKSETATQKFTIK